MKNIAGDSTNFEINAIVNIDVFNKDTFFNSVLTKSFFDNEKLIIINRTTDKIRVVVEDLIEKNPEAIKIILNSKNLEKKSTLRKFFEKEKTIICVPFYDDIVGH